MLHENVKLYFEVIYQVFFKENVRYPV